MSGRDQAEYNQRGANKNRHGQVALSQASCECWLIQCADGPLQPVRNFVLHTGKQIGLCLLVKIQVLHVRRQHEFGLYEREQQHGYNNQWYLRKDFTADTFNH